MSDENKPGEDEPRTVFVPSGGGAAPEAPSVPPSDPSATQAAVGTNFTTTDAARGIKVGDVLNHIFEVKRFLARGGMGEVFEGCNVNSDERVAIKVMLPALAADEKVIAMFRKEARTLTRLQHEALVQYRVLAQEPQLGVLYIVTEFIDGVNLADALGKITPSPEEQAGLLRRLASGLRAAHALGAVHRDLSPDNVLLADGRLNKAKVIDFGIAKDIEGGSATIVGDGFAGKLNYVAPEQLGDFGRDVGPWTDVYSLGLVMLAVANGRNVNMSGSLVDAIDKRRKGPDLAKVPPVLKPVIEAMLRPDPKQRLRSMDEVLAMLDRAGIAAAPGEEASSPPRRSVGGGISKPVLIGGGIAAALLVGAVAWFALGSGDSPIGAPSREPAEIARAAIDAAIPSVACTWLDIGSVQATGGGVQVAMRGVAGDANKAQSELSAALAAAGLQNAAVDLGDVAPITPAGCAALDTYRQVRASDADRLVSPEPRFEMVPQTTGEFAGKEAANAAIGLDVGEDTNFAILGIEPSGAITTLIPDRETFERELQASVNGKPIAREGEGYKLNIDLDHEGWSGIMLVTGEGPFDPALIEPPIGARGPQWQQKFMTAAAERGWKTEMVWFQSVNREAA